MAYTFNEDLDRELTAELWSQRMTGEELILDLHKSKQQGMQKIDCYCQIY
jgi:hypothetical protein